MDGSVRVLLVSAGASPDALVAELERLGVEITPCAFAEAEEHLETNPPDLVALAGALGAIELANMIDDVEDGPRMVIVAERKELAKLRGLNREVVVSLFAMETTEKVVGQRIESLARRAARRRDHKAADPIPVQKTSLGLPTAAQVGKVDLKKREAPPRTRTAAVTEETPPSSGSHPGAEAVSPEPAPPLEASPTPAKEAAAKANHVQDDALQNKAAGAEPTPKRPKEPRKPLETKPTDTRAQERPAPVAAPQKPPPPQRGPARPTQDAEHSIMMIDADLLESILPDAPDGDIPQISEIPMLSVVPEPEDAPVSTPPTLPPAAKAQTARLSDLQLAASPGQLDITDAESALENIDSVKLEITQDLVDHAHKEMGSSTPSPGNVADEGKASPESKGQVESAVAGSSHSGMDGSVESEETVVVDRKTADAQAEALDKTISLADLDASLGGGDPGSEDAAQESGGNSSASGGAATVEGASGLNGGADGVEEPSEMPAADGQKVQAPKEESVVENLATAGELASPKKGGGLRALTLVALVTAVVGGVYAVQSGNSKDGTEGAKATSAAEPKTVVLDGEAKGSEQEDAASSGDKAASPPAAPEVGSEGSETDPGEDPTPNERVTHPEAAGVARTPSLQNDPFKREDTNATTCAALLGADAPEKGADPVSEASLAWEKARGAIVRGKLDEAHRYMCEAVTINPESAAVEGLAGHYLALGSYAEALRWANKADELRPGQTEIGNLKGDIYAMMGDVEKARNTWLGLLNIGPEEASRLRPISKDYSVEAGRHLRRGDLVRAEIFFRRAVILDPENLNGMMGLAKVYHRLEMPAYARAFCEMSLKVSDVIPEVHVLLGEMALADGNKLEARTRFERALAVRPDFFPAKRGLSQVK